MLSKQIPYLGASNIISEIDDSDRLSGVQYEDWTFLFFPTSVSLLGNYYKSY